jgi:translation initiation factor IF-3
VPEVRVIDETGEQVGVMPTEQALELARVRNLDLVEVAPKSRPPVCRIMDFGKFKYEKKKKSQRAKKRAHQVRLKEIRMGPKIDSHDLEVKIKRAREFLDEGFKVQFNMFFRGREIMYKDLGFQQLRKVRESLDDIAKVEREPKLEGWKMNMIFAARKQT